MLGLVGEVDLGGGLEQVEDGGGGREVVEVGREDGVVLVELEQGDDHRGEVDADG